MRASQGVGTQEEFSLDPFENDIGGERSSTHAIFVRPRMRADECSGVFSASDSSRGSHSDLSPCAKHRIPSREQAMTMRLSGRGKHRVMKAMAGKPDMAMGKEPACANGDCDVDRVNSVAEGGEEAIEPIPQSVDARLLARGNSSDSRFNLDN